MANSWTIKGKRKVDGVDQIVDIAVVKGIELHDEWMVDCYVTGNVWSPEPIDWHFDDFLVYRGEVFSISYDPNVVKKARRGTYGEGFTYENIKLYSLGYKMRNYGFKDVVLYDNLLTYTSLATFSFFCASIEDFADRLQANLNRSSQSGLISGWKVLTPDWDKVHERCPGVSQSEWEQYFTGNESAGETDVNIDIDRQNCKEVIKYSYEKFGLAYYLKGTTIIIGGKPILLNTGAQNIFRYGKGLGLYEIERTSDDQQEVITKLFAYGSEQNMPLNYYANIGKKMWTEGVRDTISTDPSYIIYGIKTTILFNRIKPATNEGVDITLQYGNLTVRANCTSYTENNVEYVWWYFIKDTGGSDLAFYNALGEGKKTVYVIGGANINKWPKEYTETTQAYPSLLSINRLMLPGFPEISLDEWVRNNEDEDIRSLVDRYYFSDNELDPWIKSKNADTIGNFEGTVNFDGSQQKEIYPTINNTDAGLVTRGSVITDNGYVTDPDTFEIEVADGVLDWKEAYENAPSKDDIAISMTSGYCTGRDFKLKKEPKRNATDDGWVLTLDRHYDSSMGRYFPYHDSYDIGYCQIRSRDLRPDGYQGDTFVVTGIELPAAYIEAASEKLLIAACGYLDRRDHIRYTYLPKIDEIFMQRDKDERDAESYHDIIRAGMKLEFEDSDLGIWHAPFIDNLTIKEDGNNGIPTYDVVLRDEKEKGALEKLVDSISELMANPPTQVVERQQRVLQYVEYPEWDPNGLYYHETLNTDTDVLETSMVWHKGKKWMCLRSLTSEEPGLGAQDWVVVEGDTAFYVDFMEDYQLYDPDNFHGTLTILCKWGTEDVTSRILQPDIVWTRYTEDPHGEPRTASDTIWNNNHDYSAWQTGRGQLVLQQSDLDAETEFPSLVRFRCDVTLRDGKGDEIMNDYVEMEYNSNN